MRLPGSPPVPGAESPGLSKALLRKGTGPEVPKERKSPKWNQLQGLPQTPVTALVSPRPQTNAPGQPCHVMGTPELNFAPSTYWKTKTKRKYL